MKTPDEIKKGMLCYIDETSGACEGIRCDVCPNRHEYHCFECVMEDALAYIRKIEAERDRYWEFIKGMGCDSCSGDCDKCDGQSGWTWSGEVVE